MYQTPKQQLVVIGLSTFLAAFSLGSIVTFTDPYSAGMLTHGFFYLSLFLVSLGLFTLIGLTLRQIFRQKVFVINLSNSFRQAFLVAVLITGSFGLQTQRLLFWWVLASLILFLLFVEIFLNLKV